MGALHSGVGASCPCENDPHWQVVQRVAASQFFSKAPKLKAFLLYVCENALLGRPENLTAQLIGTRVFGREPGYIPSEDNIVRVEARELRKRLAAYFAAEGICEPVIIEIPKGSYAPQFVVRQTRALAAIPDNGTTFQRPQRPDRRRWLAPVIAATLIAVTAVVTWQITRSSYRKQEAAYLAGLPESHVTNPTFSIYAKLLGTLGTNPRRDALLVLSNPLVMTYVLSDSPAKASSAHVPVSSDFNASLRAALQEKDPRFLALNITRDGYTGFGEAVAAFHIGRLMNLLGRRVRLTQGRFLNWDYIDRQDLILLGGPHSNNWRYEKDTKIDFSICGPGITNAHPRPGEQSAYKGTNDTDYALIEKITTPYRFETLVVAGIGSAGTAAAGQFFANPEKMKSIYRQLSERTRGKEFPSEWEVLIKVPILDNQPLDSAVIALRP